MAKLLIISTLMFAGTLPAIAQERIPWSPSMQLTLADFRSGANRISPELSTYSLTHGANVELSFFMNAYAYMATKNFNDKVVAFFTPAYASLSAPDDSTAQRLVAFERYFFDLTELYARKMRQEISEQKRVSSNFDFANPIFERLHHELQVEGSRVFENFIAKGDDAALAEVHIAVRLDIEARPDFCQTCKLPKRKKG